MVLQLGLGDPAVCSMKTRITDLRICGRTHSFFSPGAIYPIYCWSNWGSGKWNSLLEILGKGPHIPKGTAQPNSSAYISTSTPRGIGAQHLGTTDCLLACLGISTISCHLPSLQNQGWGTWSSRKMQEPFPESQRRVLSINQLLH